MFQMEGVDLEFTPEALHAIAAKALERKTGARGLRSICEELLQQTMFDLPSEQGVMRVVVTGAAARGEEQPRRVLASELMGEAAAEAQVASEVPVPQAASNIIDLD